MTKKELCEKYNISENTFSRNFPKTRDNIMKKYGVFIIKEGRGESADYKETYPRADVMVNEKKEEVLVIKDGLSGLVDFNFLVFLGICMTPMTTFYGSYNDFLDYVELTKTKNNIKLLKEALELLSNMDYINYTIDKTNVDFFWAGLYNKTREEMSIKIGMIDKCKALAKKHNKKTWIPLLKTWIGMQYMYNTEGITFTVNDLSELTGLTPYQIRESRKLLEDDEDNFFVTKKVYVAKDKCIGTEVTLNAFKPENVAFVEAKQ